MTYPETYPVFEQASKTSLLWDASEYVPNSQFSTKPLRDRNFVSCLFT